MTPGWNVKRLRCIQEKMWKKLVLQLVLPDFYYHHITFPINGHLSWKNLGKVHQVRMAYAQNHPKSYFWTLLALTCLQDRVIDLSQHHMWIIKGGRRITDKEVNILVVNEYKCHCGVNWIKANHCVRNNNGVIVRKCHAKYALRKI